MQLFQIYGDTYFYMGIWGLVFWILFSIRKILGIGYKPYKEPYIAPVSVIIPSYNEDKELLQKCLDSIIENQPTEIICVFNGKIMPYEGEFVIKYKGKVKFIRQEMASKRHAMIRGWRATKIKTDIIVFVDSDVIWEKNTLTELLKPFNDNRIGGVASHQIIDNADASLWTSIGSWLTEMGLTTGTAFQAKKLCVSCLRGRTAAYRNKLFTEQFIHDFLNEKFLGSECRSGDDGRLTFLTLKSGYGTFLQASSKVHTVLPEKMGKFLKHRLRCNRNTYRRYLNGIWHKWFWKQNWRFQTELIASVIIPLGYIGCTTAVIINILQGDWIYLGILYLWFIIGRSIRSPKWLEERPSRIGRMPFMVLAFLFPLMLVRWYALFTLRENRWGTR